ncbi:hypothetical protein G3N59_01210 [Paraburkholderia sp. Ac-20340]|uniref:hypothetical protein n=1 Tax=Paraburkholderia sp. Ac-20340 TaxID=2703888 RepID=UPI00197E3595|nr:hypothetical protein [Paraburkholderia sp. Ac-20340]MBN3851986.1 hypothetical protein [Paraburkholderia sp. Ac-20340]
MTGVYFVLHPEVYGIDPELAERVARELGGALIVCDSLFDGEELRMKAACEKLARAQFDLPEFASPTEIDNRAARRRAKFSRRTNNDGWKA